MFRLNYAAIIHKVGELLSNKDFTQTNILIKEPTRFYEIQFKGFDFIFDAVDMHIVPARCFNFIKMQYKYGNN